MHLVVRCWASAEALPHSVKLKGGSCCHRGVGSMNALRVLLLAAVADEIPLPNEH